MSLTLFDRVPFHQRMCLVFTLKCNITCDHCMLRCGPTRNETMDLDFAKELLRAGRDNSMKLAIISGGEIFLFYEELLQLMEYASQLELEIDLETNGYWGNSYEAAQEKVKQLAQFNLGLIYLSVDKYHSQFIPLENQLNIIKAAHENKLLVEVTFCTSSDRDVDEKLLQQIKTEADQVFVQPVVNVGRAIENINDIELSNTAQLPDCDSLCTTVLPNGDTFVCCEVSDTNADLLFTPMYLGNSKKEKPQDLLALDNQKRMNLLFDETTPLYYKNLLHNHSEVKKFREKKYNTICELCKEIMSIQEIRERLQNTSFPASNTMD